MEEYAELLKGIGSVKCKECDGVCLLDIYNHYFVCQHCGNKYIFVEKECE